MKTVEEKAKRLGLAIGRLGNAVALLDGIERRWNLSEKKEERRVELRLETRKVALDLGNIEALYVLGPDDEMGRILNESKKTFIDFCSALLETLE